MVLHKALTFLLTGLLTGLFASGNALAASKNVLFILDASGSMAQKFGDRTRLQAAKDAFDNLLAELPEGVDVGMEAYGHHGNKDCSVIEVMNPVGLLDAAAIKVNVHGLTPRHGSTPMAAALEKGAEALKVAQGEKAIVLISDGKETCGGDPAAVAKKLRGKGFDITTHVVGLGVNADETAQLAAIAEAGGGKYYAANNADELKTSLAEIKKKVVKKAPKIIFDEEFNDDFLSDAWQVKNDNPDSRILDSGTLIILTSQSKTESEKIPNLFLYSKDIPESNYEVSSKFTVAIPDYGSTQWIGLILYKDKDNFMVVQLFGKGVYNQRFASFGKRQGGKWISFAEAQVGAWNQDPHSYEMKIVKKRFKYTAFIKVEGEKKWRTIGTQSYLGKGLKPGIVAIHDGGRQVSAEFDWFKITTTE
ncbi:MAG: VWA domain-containing protein [Mariprofundaceae bacterium]